MNTYNVYITDLFCGNLNYSYVTKFKVRANTERGAVHKIAKETGLSFRHQYCEIWHSTTRGTGLVIDNDDDNYPSYDYEEAHVL